jgi:hypothetical protein
MVRRLLVLVACGASFFGRAQQLKVEFDKNTDFSHYKTFSFGDGQITTHKDLRQVPDATVHKWIRESITFELKNKGLTRVDSAGDLVISYLTGTEKGTHSGKIGPLGMTPGSEDRSFSNDYQHGSLIIDINNARNNLLLWRISATSESNLSESERAIEEVVQRGFKKLTLKPKKSGKKT